MTYELAKQLKDAGFPEKYTKDCHCLPVLSLSNLIDACGEHFDSIEKVYGAKSSEGWKAICRDIPMAPVRASTPEEAVAKLWLALHTSTDKS
jgi:hypothetical protein